MTGQFIQLNAWHAVPRPTNVETAPLLFEYARRKQAENQIDRACVAQALQAARALPAGMRFAVNVHASTLGRERDFALYLQDLATQYGLDLARVTVEIVENLPFWDEVGFFRTLEALRGLGVKIALDDIGMGYSNYRMMLDARPDYFKIDRYLVEGSHSDYARQVVLESIVGLADKLNATVVAEGITNQADLDTARRYGLRLMQGHLFAKASSAAEIAATAKRWAARPRHYTPSTLWANAMA